MTTVPTMFLAAGVSVRLDHDRHVGGRGAGGRGCEHLNSHRPRHRQADGTVRTGRRPLVTGEVSPRAALVFGIVLSALSVIWLAATTSVLSAVLAAAAIASTCSSTPWGSSAVPPEHRLGWRRHGLLTGTNRLGPGDGRPELGGRRAVRHHLLLDPAALLATLAAVPGRLRGRRRADAAGEWPPVPAWAARSSSTAGCSSRCRCC